MSKKLLLADDSITIQKVIQITFAHEDYDLTITDNGDAALAKARELKPDLVMADVYMPGKNGYELTAAIKQDPALQDTPVLLLAGSFEPFDEEKARDCRANAWIEKPFESQSLIDKVAELLSASPAQAAAPQPAAVPEPAPQATSPADFDQPLTSAAEDAEETEGSFGDISFAEETPVFAHEPSADIDDWSDVAAEPEMAEPAVERAYPLDEGTAEEDAEDFVFEEQEPAAAEETASFAEAADLDAFDMSEEEIMPLDEDDILGAEDLEQIPQEQTLAAWSRDSVPEEDIFAAEETDFVEESPGVEVEPEVQDVPVFEAPDTEFTPAFAEPAVEEPAVTAETTPAEKEPEQAAVPTAMVDVRDKASSMSEEEIEQIIEKVVTKVVEKLAGTILERVAWEVVPDLAESLIREEIRKIKDAAA